MDKDYEPVSLTWGVVVVVLLAAVLVGAGALFRIVVGLLAGGLV